MTAALLACAAYSSALGGFTALSLAMDRHHEDAFGRGTTAGRWAPRLQWGGSALLALSLACSLWLQGRTMGWVFWLGALTAAGLSVVGIVGYLPKRARPIGIGAATVAGLCLAMWLLLK